MERWNYLWNEWFQLFI